MQHTMMVSGMARLYEFLAHVKQYPVPLRFAAICSGIQEDEARKGLQASPFTVVDDHIVTNEAKEQIERLTLAEANELYEQLELATYCKDGRPAWQFYENSNTSRRYIHDTVQ